VSRRRWLLVLVLGALFLFRLGYGLTSDFWTEDERQIYLIGLRAQARGEWPYFGPDVVWTESRIPGALQGLLVAAPLSLLPVPEAPFVLLNVLSFAALGLLAWFVSRRLPELPAWFVWGGTLTVPWTLNFSTHVINPSYVLFGAVLFFVGFFEAWPGLRRGLVPPALAFGMMGAGITWIAQIHLSWVLLPPFAALAWLAQIRRGQGQQLVTTALALAGGLVLCGLTLAPTLWRFGLAGGVSQNVELHVRDLRTALTILAQFLSFPSFELNRFVGLNVARRLAVLCHQPWLVPFVALVGVAGLLQPVVLLALGFRRAPWSEWTALRVTVGLSVLWVYLSYFFSVKEPLAHAFYLLFPVALIYSFYAWALLWRHHFVRISWAVLLGANVLVHLGLAVERAGERSLYADRRLIAAAIAQRQDRLLGRRRPMAPAATAIEPPDPLLSGFAQRDVEVVRARWRQVVGGRVSVWHVRLQHKGRDAAYVDLRYVTRYWDAADRPCGSETGLLKRILEPGDMRTFEIVDGMVHPGAARGTFEITGGEPMPPLVPGR
jgi:hypothetical protein